MELVEAIRKIINDSQNVKLPVCGKPSSPMERDIDDSHGIKGYDLRHNRYKPGFTLESKKFCNLGREQR